MSNVEHRNPTISIRGLVEGDYPYVITRVNDWWGGRDMASMLPRLFFQHFAPTSFAAVDDSNNIVGFLCGFVSQSDPSESYIHFVGVDPAARGLDIGRRLYEAFFDRSISLGCETVHCVTAPVNTGSQAFHTRMGFGSTLVENYDGNSDARIVMSRRL
jgi:ribosomal protein S18 acetylase RimI-like enzyme